MWHKDCFSQSQDNNQKPEKLWFTGIKTQDSPVDLEATYIRDFSNCALQLHIFQVLTKLLYMHLIEKQRQIGFFYLLPHSKIHASTKIGSGQSQGLGIKPRALTRATGTPVLKQSSLPSRVWVRGNNETWTQFSSLEYWHSNCCLNNQTIYLPFFSS